MERNGVPAQRRAALRCAACAALLFSTLAPVLAVVDIGGELRVGYAGAAGNLDVERTVAGTTTTVDGAWSSAHRVTVDYLLVFDTPLLDLLAGIGGTYDRRNGEVGADHQRYRALGGRLLGGVALNLAPILDLELLGHAGRARAAYEVITPLASASDSSPALQLGVQLDLVLRIPTSGFGVGVGIGLLQDRSTHDLDFAGTTVRDEITSNTGFATIFASYRF